MKCRKSKWAVAALLVEWAWAGAGIAASPDSTQNTGPATVNLTEENDSFFTRVDRHYTQGLRLSTSSPESSAGSRARIADGLILASKAPEIPSGYRYGFVVGQSIFTPTDTLASTPNPRDRPYAGWLYLGAAWYRQADRVLDRAEVVVGVVGPAAQGEEVQNSWHRLTRRYLGLSQVNGWNSQLHNEPGVVITQERKMRLAGNAGPIELDLLPEVNASVGNVYTYGAVGLLARLGQRISADWGPPRVQPAVPGGDFIDAARLDGRSFGWYAFAGGEARAVARNIFLDGNTFRSSASVKRERFVVDLTAGLSALFERGRATLAYTRRSREFETQAEDDQFLSITVSFLF